MGIVPPNTLDENDKNSIDRVIKSHQEKFGEKKLESIRADKGYYLEFNINLAKIDEVKEIGIQVYKNSKWILN